MKKLFIQEDKREKKPAGYDHVFSFLGGADFFPDEYLSGEEDLLVYDQIYDSLLLNLEKNKSKFIYRGVDLIWCFKKAVFECLYRLMLRYLILKELVERHQNYDLFIEEKPSNSTDPYLSRIVPSSPLSGYSRLHLVPSSLKENELKVSKPNFIAPFKKLWPRIISKGKPFQAEVAIFSDLAKSDAVLKRLGSKRAVFYNITSSPKLYVRSLFQRFTFYQATFSGQARYAHLARGLKDEIKKKRPFQGLKIRDLDCETLAAEYLELLFDSQLPELLFHIDQFRFFFERARSLKSALLDQDINPIYCAFCQLAAQYQAKTFVECHGSLGHKSGYLPLTADFIFAWGRAQKDKLTQWGCETERVIVSGCSRYQSYQDMNSDQIKRRVCREFKLDPDKKLILVGFTPLKYYGRVFERRLNKAISDTLKVTQEFPEAQFILKIHPGDPNKPYYLKLIKKNELSRKIIVLEKHDSLLLAKAADFLIVYRSTYAIDGFAIGKPVICLYDEGICLLLEEYKKFDVFRNVYNPNELEHAISDFLQGKYKPLRLIEARRECLNEGNQDPVEIITNHLLNPAIRPVNKQELIYHVN